MKKYILIITIAVTSAISSLTLCAQSQIVIGSFDSLYSNILNENRKIWVHIPKSAQNSSLEKYPILYLLDGDSHFHSVTGMITQLSTVNGNTVLPEMIVVGIPNTDRLRDLTPSHVGDSSNTSGGGEPFITFLYKELIPYIDSKYPTSPYRTLVGHSFGGLTVVNALINHPANFDNYLAIDPSLWWDDQKLFKKSIAVLQQKNFENKSLYVAVANTMAAGMDTSFVVKDTTSATIHIRSILQLSKAAEKSNNNGLNFAWKYYENESHSSAPLISEYDGLHFLFSWLQFNELDKIQNPESSLTGKEMVKLITSFYEEISKKLNYEVLPPESKINSIAYSLMANKAYDKSYEFFNWNVQNYPKSANVYDSMGDYYMSQSNTDKAIEYFTKSVEIGGIPESKEKLDKLRE